MANDLTDDEVAEIKPVAYANSGSELDRLMMRWFFQPPELRVRTAEAIREEYGKMKAAREEKP